MAKVKFLNQTYLCQKATFLNFMVLYLGSNEKKNSGKDLKKIEARFT